MMRWGMVVVCQVKQRSTLYVLYLSSINHTSRDDTILKMSSENDHDVDRDFLFRNDWHERLLQQMYRVKCYHR